ncbi:MAG: electron transfer flavoprotein subunit beta/FixA family protein [Chloroflexota bacterium]
MTLDILVCVKRVPAPGAKMTLLADEQDIETKYLGFTISPHEECGVEEAVQLIEKHGGTSTVLTLGTADAVEQLRYCMSLGMDKSILLERTGHDWDPMATSRAIIDAIQARKDAGENYNLFIFGNESADSGGYQVGTRVAHAFDMPCVTGIKKIEITEADGQQMAIASRETGAGMEVFEVPLPAVLTVKEGINLPRYPSVPGRLKAKRKPVDKSTPTAVPGGPVKSKMVVPEEAGSEVQILGRGPEAAPKVVDILKELGVL